MAKPLPPITIPAATKKPTRGKTTYSHKQLAALWINAGGDPNLADTMAAIAQAESSGRVDAVSPPNKNGTVDRGLWQINSVHQDYVPGRLISDPAYNARAAVEVYNRQGLSAWTTYNTGAYQQFVPKKPTPPLTPEQKAEKAAAEARAKAENPEYIQATTDLSTVRSQAVAAAKATAHISDPWVTVSRNRKGFVTGFGEATGEKPPANVLTAGGIPVTHSQFNDLWQANYDNLFQAFTGRTATPDEMADIISEGTSVYTLRDRLAKSSQFKASPIWKQNAAGYRARYREITGVDAPDEFIRKALAQDWSAQSFDENAQKSPQFEKGPVFRAKLAEGEHVYQGIYGQMDEGAKAWVRQAVKNNWTPDSMAAALREDPDYKYSLEARGTTLAILDRLGMFIGARPIVEDVPRLPGTSNTLAAFRDALKPDVSAEPVMATLPKPAKPVKAAK